MDNTARNFHAHGGSEWVIGGKLTFLPGASVEGAEGLFGNTFIISLLRLFHKENNKNPENAMRFRGLVGGKELESLTLCTSSRCSTS